MVLQQKPLEKAYFIVKITGPVMVRPASSDKWKAPLDIEGRLKWSAMLQSDSDESLISALYVVLKWQWGTSAEIP